MRLFLCGGGSGNQTTDAIKKLNLIIEHSKPLLYIPLAMEKYKYDSCYDWIQEELKNVDIPSIDMVRSSKEIENKNLDNYSAIFIGGGNTYKLLKELKECKAFDKIKEYLANNGIVFGGSAGAIILGQCIDTCKYTDKNDVGLEDLMGFNVFNNLSFLCHFTNEIDEKTEINRKYLLELSKEEKILALPEEDTIYVEDGKFEVIGNKPYYMFDSGNMITFNSSIDRKKEFFSIRNEIDLMKFMNGNITYGWIDRFGNKYLNTLKNFRENYRISSIDEMLVTGLGTCIEQAKMIQFIFNKLGLENKIFCHLVSF